MDSSDKNQSRQTITAKEGSTISNIVQAVIHLPAWAWVTGMLTLSLCLCIAIISAAALSNTTSIRKLLPTPMAFNTATPDESLIIVANFEDRSNGTYSGPDRAQYIYEQLDAQVKKDKLNITVRRLDQVVDDNTAKSIGEAYHATLVIWGWSDTLTVTPRIERIKNLQGRVSDMESFRVSLANPGNVEFETITDLPNQVSYLIMFTLAADNNINNKYDSALIYINNAIQIASADSKDVTNPNEAYVYRGLIYNNNKEYELALTDVNKVIELDPNYAFAYLVRGNVHDKKKEYDLAIADYTKAIELKPDDAYPYNNRGYNHDKKQEYDLAIADYTKAIELKPDDANPYMNRGIVQFEKQEYDLAIADYTKAIELNPDFAYPYNNRGIVHNEKQEYDLAITDFTKTIELDHNYASAYNNRCWAYYKLGKYEEALPDCEKAIELEPNDPETLDSRASVYEALGRKSDAIKDFQKILEISKNPELVKRANEELKKLKGN